MKRTFETNKKNRELIRFIVPTNDKSRVNRGFYVPRTGFAWPTA